MKTFTTLSSIVLLASTLGFASTAMAAGDRVAPTRTGATALNPTGSATGAGTVSVPASVSVATGGTVTITPTATTGAVITEITANNGTQGGFPVACTTTSCTYTETKHGVINNDTVALTLKYTVNGTPVTVKKVVQVTIAPPAHS
jgi:hypothetical protein